MADDVVAFSRITRNEARSLGLKRYFTGRVCKHGHISEREVISATCIMCRDAKVASWHQINPEKSKAYRDKWRNANREKVREMCRDYARRNKAKMAENGKAYYRANKEKHRAFMRKWKNEHVDECIVQGCRSRARKFGWTGPVLTVEQYRQMVAQQSGRCAYCMEERKLVLEHVEPVVYGGSFAATNCLLACRECNGVKAQHPLAFFLRRLANQRSGLWTATTADVQTLLDVPWRSA